MTTPVDSDPDLDESSSADEDSSPDRRLRVVLIAVLAVAVLAISVTAGWIVGNRGGTATVSDSSVDAGFARDMSTHHTQAVEMAGYTRDHTSDPSIKLLAYDIETAQYFELGQMQGWLDGWKLPRSTNRPVMGWMAGHDHTLANGLMPGMATPAEIDKLETMTGKPLDIYFLQLMLRHHQGGAPMAQYASVHATEPYVRNLADKMYRNQSNEIIQMEQLLRQRGAAPLPAPN
jgi:uncharacterized protein (DUF305 family)